MPRRTSEIAERIDLSAPWQLLRASLQREQPGAGRYHVEATFITGKPGAYQYASVSYWLPAATGHDNHTQFLSYREIVNSRRHPSAFEGMELPSEDSNRAA